MSASWWTRIPEMPLSAAAFFLNFFWEMTQSPLYTDVGWRNYGEILRTRLHCTLGDVLITLVLFWIVAAAAWDRYWPVRLRLRHVVAFTFLGLGYTVLSEWVNTDLRAAWGYGARMPRLPWIGTGLAPFFQWVVLPPSVAWVTGRIVREGLVVCQEAPPVPRSPVPNRSSTRDQKQGGYNNGAN